MASAWRDFGLFRKPFVGALSVYENYPKRVSRDSMGGPKSYVDRLRVQVPNNHILTQNLCHNHYYPKTKYLIIGYLDPLG